MSEFQEKLRQPYSAQLWAGLLPRLLPGRVELFSQPVEFPLTTENQRTIATGFRQFGRAVISDGQGGQKILGVFEVDVAAKVDLLRNRVALRQLVARCIDEVSAHAVLAFFVQSGSKPYRLTYATRESVLNTDTLAIETRETATRRFTFVLGPGETRRTAAMRLHGLVESRESATLADVTDAFSVEKLNREFFDTYKQHYQSFCSHLIDGDAPERSFGLKLRGLDDKERDKALKPVRDFVKKLLGPLVFLHFLQKKGWLGCPADASNWKNGDPDFLGKLFRECPARERERFHSRRLVPLFFDTLNRERKDDIFSITGTRVPYLNGGLFEKDFDGVDEVDFPAHLFAELLEFFSQYNFTIDENDPDDHEIGIDPEMLGHIFENLLEDNKDKGAYYTPKAVVQYMCQQSLIQTLVGHFPGDEAARTGIEALIRKKEPIDPQKETWLSTHATELEKILDDLRVCDPAIGSGAFPIGLLQEIFWTKLTLHPALKRAKTKREIIQRSIHGVDLDHGAVEIARLRFWLALIVDESEPLPFHSFIRLPRAGAGEWYICPRCKASVRYGTGHDEYCRGHHLLQKAAAIKKSKPAASPALQHSNPHRFPPHQKPKRDFFGRQEHRPVPRIPTPPVAVSQSPAPLPNTLMDRVWAAVESVAQQAWESVAEVNPPEEQFRQAKQKAIEFISMLSPSIKRKVNNIFTSQKWLALSTRRPKV